MQAGYTVRTQGLVDAQRAAGIDAHVCTPPGFPVAQGHLGAAPFTTLAGVPYHRDLAAGRRLDLPDRHLEAYAVTVAALARSVGADVLHAHSKHVNAQAALLAGRRLGVPVVYEARGFLEDTWRTRGGDADSDFYRWTRETETRCLSLADAVVTLSQSMRDDVVARGVDADAGPRHRQLRARRPAHRRSSTADPCARPSTSAPTTSSSARCRRSTRTRASTCSSTRVACSTTHGSSSSSSGTVRPATD